MSSNSAPASQSVAGPARCQVPLKDSRFNLPHLSQTAFFFPEATFYLRCGLSSSFAGGAFFIRGVTSVWPHLRFGDSRHFYLGDSRAGRMADMGGAGLADAKDPRLEPRFVGGPGTRFCRAPYKIHVAHLKHGFFYQNKGKPPLTRQCSGV